MGTLHYKKLYITLLNIRFISHTIVVLSLVILSPPLTNAAGVKLYDTITVEIKRAVDVLGKESPPLYYLGCGITDIEDLRISSSFGAVVENSHSRSRFLDVDARCGNYDRDNTHPLPGYRWDSFTMPVRIPLGEEPLPIRMKLWQAIEESYRKASERYAQVKALAVTKAALRDQSGDFSKYTPSHYFEERKSFQVDRNAWVEKVKSYTMPLRESSNIFRGSASFMAIASTRTFANSEGTKIQSSEVGYLILLEVATRSEDGLDIPISESFFAWDIDELPEDKVIITKMHELSRAVCGTCYSRGPRCCGFHA